MEKMAKFMELALEKKLEELQKYFSGDRDLITDIVQFKNNQTRLTKNKYNNIPGSDQKLSILDQNVNQFVKSHWDYLESKIEVEESENKLQKINQEITQKQEELSSLSKQIGQLKQQEKEKLTDVESLKVSLEQLKSERNELKNEIDSLGANRNELKKTIIVIEESYIKIKKTLILVAFLIYVSTIGFFSLNNDKVDSNGPQVKLSPSVVDTIKIQDKIDSLNNSNLDKAQKIDSLGKDIQKLNIQIDNLKKINKPDPIVLDQRKIHVNIDLTNVYKGNSLLQAYSKHEYYIKLLENIQVSTSSIKYIPVLDAKSDNKIVIETTSLNDNEVELNINKKTTRVDLSKNKIDAAFKELIKPIWLKYVDKPYE